MCSVDDLCFAGVAETLERPTALWGGEPQRLSSRASVLKRRSESREFVATLSCAPRDASASLRRSHAHANQMIDMRGAVTPLAVACAKRDLEAEPVRLIISSRPVLLIRCERLARLCVLMNPILPGARSIGTWPAYASLSVLWTEFSVPNLPQKHGERPNRQEITDRNSACDAVNH